MDRELTIGQEKPLVSLVVLSHNRIAELKVTIPLVREAVRNANAELIVVDNASSDGSQEYLRETLGECKWARVICNDDNLGVAGGRNTGYRVARGDYVVSLDDDTHIQAELIHQTIDAFDRLPCTGILAYRVKHFQTMADSNPHGEQECEVGNFHGAGHAFRRSLFLQIGYLDNLCSFGGEEIEMSFRARAAGFVVQYMPSIVVYHNSFLRPGKVGIERRIRWAYNYSRILHQYLPPGMAFLYTMRLNLLDLFFFRIGLFAWPRFCRAVWRGRTDGSRLRVPLPEHVLRFYRNPDLRPEFGNVPIRCKVLRALRKRMRMLLNM